MSYIIKDGNDQSQTMASAGNGASPPGLIPEYNLYGTTGTDWSQNAANIPADSNNIALRIIPANPNRSLVEIQNQTGAVLQIVRDDGAGNQQTSIFLSGLYATWRSASFKGRLTIYGPTGTMLGAYED